MQNNIENDPQYVFNFSTPGVVKPPILKITNGFFKYKPELDFVLEDVQFMIDMNSRITLLGANGSGKSTLLKLLSGQLKLTQGDLYRNNQAQIALFNQHHLEDLDLTLSPLEQFMANFPQIGKQEGRNHLGRFGISGAMSLRPMYLLSGG